MTAVNPLGAPKERRCRVCELVASPGDVTIRLYGPDFAHLPLDGALEYLQAVGLSGTRRQIMAVALSHRRHVDKFIARGGVVAPADEGVSRIPAPIGNIGWVDVNQGVMNTGAQAQHILLERIRTQGEVMDTKDLLGIMNAGATAATARASAEMKGQLRKAEALAKLASGFQKAPE